MLSRVQNCTIINRRLCSHSSAVIYKDKLPFPAYQPRLVEENKYKKWEKEERFQPVLGSDIPNFCMVLPPPNVTGKLHLGHALSCTIQDVILRRKSSMGHNVLWIPGTDHAGIATQGVVEKHLKTTKNLDRFTLGREQFNDEVLRWKNKHGNSIADQLKTLGCSLDWSRHMFTMDPGHTKAVNAAFIKLFNKGLIYRKNTLVNWCPSLKSTLSDIEVEHREINGPTEMEISGYPKKVKFGQLYSFAYKIFGTNDEVVVSTTMPETMLGDAAVAVHPDDERYKHLRGKRLFHPFKDYTIPIIFDEFVDISFGTGAVKITPAHSKVDFEFAKRHNLLIRPVFDESGLMINAEQFTNTHRYDCREEVVKQLEDMGFMRSILPHKMSLPICSRTGDIVEYLPKEQWFLSCKTMNNKAKDAYLNGHLTIEPEKYVKNWLDWTDDDRDWCISRQLWWGHQIPAYRCSVDHNVVWIAANTESEAKMKASKYLREFPENIVTYRDQDVLDTWFSSGVYPFSALGWPKRTTDFAEFYPLSLMATGHDILGFWVHRMVMLGLELTGKLPFNNVFLHGIICDSKGAKMSKSKGNVLDPMDVIQGISLEKLKQKFEDMHADGILTKEELKKALHFHKANFSQTKGIPECGVDALRFTLLSQDPKSHFVNFDVSMCHANKLFCNKIWQCVNYVQMGFNRLPACRDSISRNDLTYFDRWILSRLANAVEKVNNHMDTKNFHLATKVLRHHIYNEFCDIYIEATKSGFAETDSKNKYAHAHTLSAGLNTSLRCLSPFMIYLTEELIPKIPNFKTNIIHNFKDENKKHFDFPQAKDFECWRNKEIENRVGKVLETTALVRELKGLCEMPNKVRPSVCIKTKDDNLKTDLVNNLPIFLNLARSCTLDFDNLSSKQYIRGIINNECEVLVEVLGTDVEAMVSIAKEKLVKKINKLEKNLKSLEKNINTDEYLDTVPDWERLVDKEKLIAKRKELDKMYADLQKFTT